MPFEKLRGATQLKVEVMDEDKLKKDDLIGTCTFDLLPVIDLHACMLQVTVRVRVRVRVSIGLGLGFGLGLGSGLGNPHPHPNQGTMKLDLPPTLLTDPSKAEGSKSRGEIQGSLALTER